MPNINFSNVNISIHQFQEISTGDINAGEVRLADEHTLDKINNRAHRRGSNTVTLSHHEVLAIKNAFVRTLSESGVGADEINRIRQKLGLAPRRRWTPPSSTAASSPSPASKSAKSSTGTPAPSTPTWAPAPSAPARSSRPASPPESFQLLLRSAADEVRALRRRRLSGRGEVLLADRRRQHQCADGGERSRRAAHHPRDAARAPHGGGG